MEKRTHTPTDRERKRHTATPTQIKQMKQKPKRQYMSPFQFIASSDFLCFDFENKRIRKLRNSEEKVFLTNNGIKMRIYYINVGD